MAQALAVFTATIVALLALAAADVAGSLELPERASSQFVVGASTTFTITGIAAVYRALDVRNR